MALVRFGRTALGEFVEQTCVMHLTSFMITLLVKSLIHHPKLAKPYDVCLKCQFGLNNYRPKFLNSEVIHLIAVNRSYMTDNCDVVKTAIWDVVNEPIFEDPIATI